MLKNIVFTLGFLLLFISNGRTQKWEQLGKDICGDNYLDRIGMNGGFAINEKGDKITIGYSNSFNKPKVRVFELTNSSWQQVGNTIYAKEAQSSFGQIVSSNGQGDVIGVSAYDYNKNCAYCGNITIYDFEKGKWVESAKLFGTDEWDRLGLNLEFNRSGNVFAASQQTKVNCEEGYACHRINVYEKNGTTWLPKGNPIETPRPNSISSTFRIDSSGNTIVNFGFYDAVGFVVEVYKYTSGVWTKYSTYSIKLEEGPPSSLSVSANGKYLILGLPNYGSDEKIVQGQAKVFEIKESGFLQIGQTLYGENKYDYFGESVQISDNGKTIVVGASAGKTPYVRVYKMEKNQFIQIGQDLQGRSVEMNGDGSIIAIGDYQQLKEMGVVRMYKYQN